MIQYTSKGYLIPGVHPMTFSEVVAEFGTRTARRRKPCAQLEQALRNLKAAGVVIVYIDGSFTTTKDDPNDVDGCWDAHKHIDTSILDPVFLQLQPHERKAMKAKYGVDFLISQAVEGSSGVPFVKFFQLDRDGNAKGIIQLRLDQEGWT